MRQIRIIAHGDRAQDPFLAETVDALRAQGHTVTIRPTWESGDAATLARESLDHPVDLVVAAGGDGTLNEVVNGVVAAGLRVPVGLLPLGTANDFATAADFPLGDAVRMADLLGNGDPVAADVICAGEDYYINAATGGFAAEATTSVAPVVKKVLGGLAYFLAGIVHLAKLEPRDIVIEGPGLRWAGPYYGFAVMNARTAGGGHPIAPEARIDDGLLDVLVVPADESLLAAARVSDELRIEADEDYVIRWRCPKVQIWAPDGVAVNIDGEPRQVRELDFELYPRALQLVLPRTTPLLTPSE